jgi:hypothetical protein
MIMSSLVMMIYALFHALNKQNKIMNSNQTSDTSLELRTMDKSNASSSSTLCDDALQTGETKVSTDDSHKETSMTSNSENAFPNDYTPTLMSGDEESDAIRSTSDTPSVRGKNIIMTMDDTTEHNGLTARCIDWLALVFVQVTGLY